MGAALEALLNLSFKGKRDYLQSADIWVAVGSALEEAGLASAADVLTIVFRRFTGAQPSLRMLHPDASLAQFRERFADVMLLRRGGRVLGALLESGRPVVRRVPFPEQQIMDICHVEDQSVSYQGQLGFSAPEILVAATKLFHQRRVAAGKRWIVTKLVLPLGFAIGSETVLTAVLKGATSTLSTRSSVYLDGRPAGEIFYSAL